MSKKTLVSVSLAALAVATVGACLIAGPANAATHASEPKTSTSASSAVKLKPSPDFYDSGLTAAKSAELTDGFKMALAQDDLLNKLEGRTVANALIYPNTENFLESESLDLRQAVVATFAARSNDGFESVTPGYDGPNVVTGQTVQVAADASVEATSAQAIDAMTSEASSLHIGVDHLIVITTDGVTTAPLWS